MTIALIGRRGSRWIEAVAARCRGKIALLELEAALEGALTLDGERVEWDGFDATSAEVALVERAVFSWPQPGLGLGDRSPQAEREARALLVSALNVLALRVRVLDPPESAYLAVAPLAALDACARAGLAVHPWTLVAHRPEGGERIWLDPGGNDVELELAPRTPRAGAPAWSPEPEPEPEPGPEAEPEGDGARFEGAVLSLLTIGGELVAARRYAAPESWGAGEPDALLAPSETPRRRRG